MQSNPGNASPKVKEKEDFTVFSPQTQSENSHEKPVEVASLEDEEDEVQILEDAGDQSYKNVQNQLVLYNPEVNGTGEIEPVSNITGYQPPPLSSCSTLNPPSRILPSVGAFTVQCAHCFKWRLIPTQEKYEKIRENISQFPFVCETAREWRPDISCDDPADIAQDGSRLWAIDKPNIAQPPPGWQRLLRIRGEGSTKFADVYYVAPTGKRLRSTVEIQKYLLEHPEYIRAGVTMAQFSFQIPKPMRENYVRKRPSRAMPSYVGTDPRSLEPTEANPLSWAGPIDYPELQIGGPGLSTPYFESSVFDPIAPPAKKQATRAPHRQMSNSNSMYDQPNIKLEEPQQSRNGAYDL